MGNKVQAHKDESDNQRKKPEGKGKDTKERKPEGKGKETKERKPEGKGKDTKERKPEKEDHIAFDDIKEQFSKIFEKLSAVKKEAKQLFSKKDISEDEQTKGLEYIGGKIEDFSQNMKEIHHHFE